MLADELDWYKGKGNSYVDDNIREIQEIYMEEEKKEEKRIVEEEEVILVKPYKISITTLSSSRMSFIADEVDQIHEIYMNFITDTNIQTTTPLSSPQIQRRTRPCILERSGNGILRKET